ncbi:MAG: hypothetical protein ACM3XM_12610 [Mycobacterium leprae]
MQVQYYRLPDCDDCKKHEAMPEEKHHPEHDHKPDCHPEHHHKPCHKPCDHHHEHEHCEHHEHQRECPPEIFVERCFHEHPHHHVGPHHCHHHIPINRVTIDTTPVTFHTAGQARNIVSCPVSETVFRTFRETVIVPVPTTSGCTLCVPCTTETTVPCTATRNLPGILTPIPVLSCPSGISSTSCHCGHHHHDFCY